MNNGQRDENKYAKLDERIAVLVELANDPKAFTQAKRELVCDFINATDADRQSGLRRLQAQIDTEVAVTLSPARVTGKLLDMIEDRITAIETIMARLLTRKDASET